MKRILSLALVLIIAATLLLTLASCGKPDGRYVDEWGESAYVFDGKTVEVIYGDESFKYLYKIIKNDDEKRIYFYDTKTKEEALDSLKYEKGDDCIYLDGVKYVKQK